jgi:hypothetical protein
LSGHGQAGYLQTSSALMKPEWASMATCFPGKASKTNLAWQLT